MTIEMILITIMLFGIVTVFSRAIQEQQMVKNLVEGPWMAVRGMIENGVWGRPAAVKSQHPGYIWRHGSDEGRPIN